MNVLANIIKVIDKINEIVGNIVKYLLLYMALTLAFEVIARYLFNSPTIWVFDLCKQALCFIGALGGGYALLYDSHVKVDVLYSNLSARTRAILDIITFAVFLVFTGILIWKGYEMAASSWAIKERSTSVLSPPLYYMKTAIPAGALLLLLQGISKLCRDILTVITGEEHPLKKMEF